MTGHGEQGTGNGGQPADASVDQHPADQDRADQYPVLPRKDEQGAPHTPAAAAQSSVLSPQSPALPGYGKPLPEPKPVTKPFWDAAKEHRLLIQRSIKTGRHVFYPRAISPFGAGDHLEWVQASGKGTVYSFTVARRPTAPAWGKEPPYVIAVVELAEGVHMTGNVVDCDPDTVRVGMPVEATYADVTPDVTLVQWRPAAE